MRRGSPFKLAALLAVIGVLAWAGLALAVETGRIVPAPETGQIKPTPPPAQAMTGGRLTVNLGPAGALAAGAAWSVDSGKTWRGPGRAVDLAAGDHVVVFKPLKGWRTPPQYPVKVRARSILTLEANYAARPSGGELTVNLGPAEADQAGAAWSVDDGAVWRAPGDATALDAGTFRLIFRQPPGWLAPPPMDLALSDGQQISIKATYVPAGAGPTGVLRVFSEPRQAFEDGASWTVDAGTNWFLPGQALRLEPGRYLIQFKDVLNWNKPADVETYVHAEETTIERGDYRPH